MAGRQRPGGMVMSNRQASAALELIALALTLANIFAWTVILGGW